MSIPADEIDQPQQPDGAPIGIVYLLVAAVAALVGTIIALSISLSNARADAAPQSYLTRAAFCQEYSHTTPTPDRWYMTTAGFLGVPRSMFSGRVPYNSLYDVTYEDQGGGYVVIRLKPVVAPPAQPEPSCNYHP